MYVHTCVQYTKSFSLSMFFAYNFVEFRRTIGDGLQYVRKKSVEDINPIQIFESSIRGHQRAGSVILPSYVTPRRIGSCRFWRCLRVYLHFEQGLRYDPIKTKVGARASSLLCPRRVNQQSQTRKLAAFIAFRLTTTNGHTLTI